MTAQHDLRLHDGRVFLHGTGLVTAISNPAAQIDFNNDPFPDRTAPR